MRAKIATKHNVAAHEVIEAFQAPARLISARWYWSIEHECWRLVVVGRTYLPRTLKGTLYPVVSHRDPTRPPVDDDSDVWWLGTARSGTLINP